jgi:hypothetical protein
VSGQDDELMIAEDVSLFHSNGSEAKDFSFG